MADGAVLRWRANIERFRPLLTHMTQLYVGHGLPGDARLLDQQQAYFDRYCATLLDVLGGHDALTEAHSAAFSARMVEAYPAYGLQFMIGLSAARVAAELQM